MDHAIINFLVLSAAAATDGTEVQWRGATPRPRSGAAAKSARLRLCRSCWEELPNTRDRGGGWEDQPHVQGAVAARVQEGLEKLSHVEGQEGRW